jgi:hypothetical protein
MITAGQIIECVRRPGADVATLQERIRNWTKEGLLLHFIGDRSPGTGRHRKYDVGTVIDVAVLDVIAEARVPIAGRDLLAALSLARAAHQKWHKHKDFKELHFLEILSIQNIPWRTKTARLHEGEPRITPGAALSIVIPLTPIFQRIRWPEASKNERA